MSLLFLKRLVQVNKRLLKFFENTISVTTVSEEKKFCLILPIKYQRARGESHHLAFMDNCPIISYTFLALSIQWVSSPSRKWKQGVSLKFHLIVLCLVWIKRTRRRGSLKFSCANPVVEISDTVAFTIPSNISDGAPQ